MTRSSLIFGLLIALLALLTGCGPGPQAVQPTPLLPVAVPATLAPTAVPSPTTADLTAKLDKTFTYMADNAMFSGAVLVMRGDVVVLRKGYGYADQAAKTPNTPATIYRIGHLTQPFTAAAILLLESQGKLSVKDSVCKYVDNCPAAWKPITLHHLLSGSSGIPTYVNSADFKQISKTAVTPDALVALVHDQPLLFSPGSDWVQSESNYVLLGLVIERVSGQSYATFLQEQIFDPLKMTATGYAARPAGLATGYQNYRWVPADATDVSAAYAAYGLYSTVDDLYRWDEAFFADTLLPRAQREAMLTSYTQPFEGWDVGYGMYLSDTANPGHHLLLHGLDWNIYPGFASVNWSWTDVDTHVVMLTNVDGDLEATIQLVTNILLAKP